ncbi:MAG: PAS domain-containing protein [Chloroflexales bacterium]|nr:PAS domain-containing protein [Chloroflexales bacterium]
MSTFPSAPGPTSVAEDVRVDGVQDLSPQEQGRLAAEAAADRATRLLIITAALSRALTAERVAAVVIEGATAVLGAAGGIVTLLNPVDGALEIIGSYGYSDTLLHSWRRIPLTVPVPLADAVTRSELILVESPEQLAARYPTLARSEATKKTQAWVALPLNLDVTTVGAMGFSFGAPKALNAEERTFLLTLAGLCAQALERVRLSEAEREALAAADEALALLDTVIDSAPIGLAVMDQEFRYTRINPYLARLNGRSVAEHLGRPARDLYPLAAKRWEPLWRQVLETGQPLVDFELTSVNGHGELHHSLVSYYPVRVGEGPILGVGITVVDITERKQAEEERQRLLASEQVAREEAQRAQAHAEEALEMREAFLSVAAHELKTPLTSLLGQAQMLERRLSSEGLLTGLNQRSLQTIVGQSRRLNLLIGDLLDGAHLESGHLTIDLRPIDLGQLVRRIAEDLQPMLPDRTLTCVVEDAPLAVHGDLMRLEQVIQNLLSNAVKYSPSGSPVTLSARRDGRHVLVSVRDEGIGIPRGALPQLFERFYRVDGPETRGVSGLGVGLYVVREIVRLHGGTVEVASTVGGGSTFTIILPLT